MLWIQNIGLGSVKYVKLSYVKQQKCDLVNKINIFH